jgi:hypothetical protein
MLQTVRPWSQSRTDLKSYFLETLSNRLLESAGVFEPTGRYLDFQLKYANAPDQFVLDCFRWERGQYPADYQLSIIHDFIPNQRSSIRGLHGMGKTALSSWLVHWFALTRDGLDWKIPTTASSWPQLSKFLWPEIHKWSRLIDWAKVGRHYYNTNEELLLLNLRLHTGEAFAITSDRPELMEGAHAEHMLYIFDEAKAIKDETFDAAEGAMVGGSENTEAYALSISTPGEPTGRFYAIQSRKPGYEDWHVKKVTKEQAIAAGRVTAQWVEQRRLQWKEDSAVYQNRVEGEFAVGEANTIIPLAWIELANQRWLQWEMDGKPGTFTCMGADIARFGEDKTVFAPRYGWVIDKLQYFGMTDTMETTGNIAAILVAHKGYAVVDVIGIGAGVVDRLREQHLPVIAFNAGEHTDFVDKSGEVHFADCRSAAWWNLREILDPVYGFPVAIPPDDMLTGDLTNVKWKMTSSGQIKVESKDDVRKRIGRSTDSADAVIQAYWEMAHVPTSEQMQAYAKGDKPVLDDTMAAYAKGTLGVKR